MWGILMGHMSVSCECYTCAHLLVCLDVGALFGVSALLGVYISMSQV